VVTEEQTLYYQNLEKEAETSHRSLNSEPIQCGWIPEWKTEYNCWISMTGMQELDVLPALDAAGHRSLDQVQLLPPTTSQYAREQQRVMQATVHKLEQPVEEHREEQEHGAYYVDSTIHV
jgi:hypothetical protein